MIPVPDHAPPSSALTDELLRVADGTPDMPEALRDLLRRACGRIRSYEVEHFMKVERLRPLIEQWRERKESAQQSGIRNGEVWPYDLGAFHALGRCLEELEALLSTPPGREK